MSDAAASATAIETMDDATTLLTSTAETWGTLSTLAMVQVILAFIPGVNYFTGSVQWILALIQLIDIGTVGENIASLATFYNNEANWKDPAAFAGNQKVKA